MLAGSDNDQLKVHAQGEQRFHRARHRENLTCKQGHDEQG
jgi:hypothetical protein